MKQIIVTEFGVLEAYQYFFSQAATGKLKVHIGQTFPLKDAARSTQTNGKQEKQQVKFC